MSFGDGNMNDSVALTYPARTAFAVTPHDTTALEHTARALYIGTTGGCGSDNH